MKTRLALLVALLVSALAPAAPVELDDGVVMDVYDTGAQDWPTKARLFVQPPLLREWLAAELAPERATPDAAANGGQALTLGRDAALTWRADFPRRSVYQVALYAKVPAAPAGEGGRWLFATLQVGEAPPLRMRLAAYDRYLCLTRFLFHAEAGQQVALTLRLAPESDAAAIQVERVRLTDQLANCARRAGKRSQIRPWPRLSTTAAPLAAPADWPSRYAELWASAPSPWQAMLPANYQLPEKNPRTGQPAKWDLYTPTRQTTRQQARDTVTGEVFPNADFPDLGWGWLSDADRRAGHWNQVYYFSAWHTGAKHPYQDQIASWANLADRTEAHCRRYAQTGDETAAREATVLLATLAWHYPLLLRAALAPEFIEGAPERMLFAGGGAWVYCAWQAEAMRKLALAYDQLFPFLHPAPPADLLAFLATRMPGVTDGESLRAALETGLLQYPADQAIRRHLTGSNGGWESCLGTLAAVQQDATIVQPWLAEMWTRCYFNNTNQGGLPDLLVNGHLDEGANLIGQVNYALGTTAFADLAELLRGLAATDPALRRYDLFATAARPKLEAVFRLPLEVRAAGGFQSQIGEGYNTPAIAIREYPSGEDRTARAGYRLAFLADGDPRCAWLLKAMGREDEDDALWARIETAAATLADPFRHTATRSLPGLGLTFLESGSASPNLAEKSALILRTSLAWGHGHSDTLDIELIARGARIVPDLATRYEAITYMTRGHNLVEIDGTEFTARDEAGLTGVGWVTALHEGGWVRYVAGESWLRREGKATPHHPYQEMSQDRCCALVDLPGGAYVVDLLRSRANESNVHTWNFHTQHADEFASNLVPGAATPAQTAWLQTIRRPGTDNRGEVASPTFGTAPEVLQLDWRCAAGLAPGVTGPVRVRTRLFGAAGLPVIVAEGAGKLAKPGAPLHFAFVRREGAETTRWLHLIEPYGDEPLLAAATELPVALPLREAGLEVRTSAGRRDVLLWHDTMEPLTAGGVTTDARFAVLSLAADGQLAGLYLVGGTYLTGLGYELRLPRSEHRTRITAFDPATLTLTVEPPLPAHLVGATAFVAEHERCGSFTLAAITGNQVRLAASPQLYQGPVASVAAPWVTVELPLPLGRIDPHAYAGLWATDGSHRQWWRVLGTRPAPGPAAGDPRQHRQLELKAEAALTRESFPLVDGRPMIYLYRFAPGQELSVPAACSLQATADGLTARTTHAATLRRPQSEPLTFAPPR